MDIFTEAINGIKTFFANPLDDEINSVYEELAYEHSDTDKLDFDFSGIAKEFVKIGGSLLCIVAIKKIEDEIALTGKAPMFIPKF